MADGAAQRALTRWLGQPVDRHDGAVSRNEADAVEASEIDAGTGGRRTQAVAVLRRLPFTATVVALMLVLGLVTGTLWNALESRPLFLDVSYGLPAFQLGQWWTVVTGAMFALTPAQYVPVAGGFAVLVGFAEYTLGTRRAAVAAIVTQAIAILGAAAVLWLLTSTTEWAWALRIADDRDVGFSAGALGAVAAATVALRPPWRARLRLLVATYAVLFFLYSGVLWDLEHLIGVAVGLAVGPLLLGRPPRIRLPRATHREWRTIAALTFALSAVIRLMLWFFPADGPLGATSDDDSAWGALVTALISLLLANGLRKGKRISWRWAMSITSVFLGVLLLGSIAVLLDPVENDLDVGDGGLPAIVVDLLLWVVQFVVLLLGRDAFRGPSARKLRKLGPLDGDERTNAVQLLHRAGGTSLSWMTTWDGNHWYVPRAEDGSPAGYVAYQLHQGAAIALSDPVAATPAARAGLLDGYVSFWESQGRVPCFFSVTQEVADWASARGWQAVVVAEEAVIDLPELEFKGKAWQDIRTALNRAGKEDVQYRVGAARRDAARHPQPGARDPRDVGRREGAAGDGLHPRRCRRGAGPARSWSGSPSTPRARCTASRRGCRCTAPTGSGRADPRRDAPAARRLPADHGVPHRQRLPGASSEQGCAFVSLSGAPLAHTAAAEERRSARPAARQARRGDGAAVRLPVAGVLQAEVQPRHRPALPGLQGRVPAAAHRPGADPRVPARHPAAQARRGRPQGVARLSSLVRVRSGHDGAARTRRIRSGRAPRRPRPGPAGRPRALPRRRGRCDARPRRVTAHRRRPGRGRAHRRGPPGSHAGPLRA